jgi:L-aspartate oxidase
VREGASLQSAAAILHAFDAEAGAAPAEGRSADQWRLANLVTVGRLMAQAALRRTESRGGHYRTDFPARDDVHWSAHVSERSKN